MSGIVCETFEDLQKLYSGLGALIRAAHPQIAQALDRLQSKWSGKVASAINFKIWWDMTDEMRKVPDLVSFFSKDSFLLRFWMKHKPPTFQ